MCWEIRTGTRLAPAAGGNIESAVPRAGAPAFCSMIFVVFMLRARVEQEINVVKMLFNCCAFHLLITLYASPPRAATVVGFLFYRGIFPHLVFYGRIQGSWS